uniref:Deoxyuridine 5'-triphosphate nucleotidohydrolase n=1 Tax=Biomphalaria glabrata TaxID=6526 RepID=A0A2C9KJ08_BIOGL
MKILCTFDKDSFRTQEGHRTHLRPNRKALGMQLSDLLTQPPLLVIELPNQWPTVSFFCLKILEQRDLEISAGKEIVKTDIQISVPDGCYGRVAPRSGLAAKSFIDVGAGVIDQDYRGNVGVVLFNFSETDFKVNKGDRIAQLICERIYIPQLCEKPSLDNTERGTGGFGSTGTN